MYRSSQDQLDIIVRLARREGYKFNRTPTLADSTTWQEALGFLRSRGYNVSTPGRSVHQRGLAYDLTGPNLNKIMEAVLKAALDGRIRLLKSGNANPIVEYKNNCVHVEIEGATLDYDPFEWA